MRLLIGGFQKVGLLVEWPSRSFVIKKERKREFANGDYVLVIGIKEKKKRKACCYLESVLRDK